MLKKIIIIFVLTINLLYPKEVSAKTSSYIALDINSGRILQEKNINNKQLIASTTKIMTCIIVLENNPLDKEITVGDEILEMYGTNIYLEVGEKIKVIDLLYGLMLRSGNDAAITLAVNTFGSEEEFVKAMNKKAKSLGMNNTTFENPHGLDEKTKNYSTAYDMSLLGRYAFNNPVYKAIISTKHYQTKSNKKSYDWYNRVSILNDYKYSLGGKNGYTPSAGKTLVSYAKKDDLTIMIISLNDQDIYNHHKNMYINLFNNYKNYLIVNKNTFKIDKSLVSNKNLTINQSFYYPLKENEIDNINTLVSVYNNQKLGKIDIYLNKTIIGTIPLSEQKKEDNKSSLIDYLRIRYSKKINRWSTK